MILDIKKIVKNIVVLLAAKKYVEIAKKEEAESLMVHSKLSAEEIKTAIDDFRETIFVPNDDIFDAIDIVKIENSNKEAYSIDFDLWTLESGLSDLTLQLTATRHTDSIEVELDNIHVL